MRIPLLDQLGFDSTLFASYLFEQSDLAIFLVNVHGPNNFTYRGLNPTHERLTGLKSAEIMDKHPHDFLPPELADKIVAHYEECRLKKTSIVYEETISFQGRGTFWLTRLIPISNENHEVMKIIGASINIDEQKEVENHLLDLIEFNKTILDLSHMGFLIFDREGHCISLNEAAREMLGIEKREELSLSLFQQWFYSHSTEQWNHLWTTRMYIPEVSIINQKREKKWLSLQRVPYYHNKRQLLLLSIADITFIKQQQEELEEKNHLIMDLLQNMPQPVIVFREDEIICFHNRQSEEVFAPLQIQNHVLSIQEVLPFFDGAKDLLYPHKKRKSLVEVSLHTQSKSKNYLLHQYIIGKENTSNCRILWSFTNITPQKSLINKLTKELHRDFLTKLYNRQGMKEILTTEWKRAIRQTQNLSLLMVDIDYFKNYNDSLGHTSGDRCLRQIAFLLREACYRPGDFVFRYGGEEFLILLTNTNLPGALVVAERIHTSLKNNPLSHPSSPLSSIVTVSIGVYCVSPKDTPIQRAIQYADIALYHAKKEGRNRTEVFSPRDDL